MKKLLSCAVLFGCVILASNSFAAEGIVGPVSVTYVSVISDHSGHKPGNLEVGISGGGMPGGVSCAANIITTLGSVEAYDHMYSSLVQALINQRQVILGVTDSAERNAFPGRCSLTLVNLQ